MTEEPRDGSRDRHRTGPLGDQDDGEQTRREDPEATRQISREPGEDRPREDEPTRAVRHDEERTSTGRERRTRTIRQESTEGREQSYPRGYFEAAEEREQRLREMYGGIDWLASFLGFIFAAVAGVFLSLIAGLVLIPLGFSANLDRETLGPSGVTALVAAGILIFLMYFFGGYVAGRLARFDGGRNGVMSVVWGAVLGLMLFAVGVFLPGPVSDLIRDFTRQSLLPTASGVGGLGLVGVAIVAGAIVLMLLGGFAGGRAGSRYHREIDRTT